MEPRHLALNMLQSKTLSDTANVLKAEQQAVWALACFSLRARF
jgi:hypothetical protein